MSFKLLGKRTDNPLPEHDSKLDLANEFNNYFKDKIDTIMMNLRPSDNNPIDPRYIESHRTTDVKFDEFSLIEVDKIKTIVRSAPSKSCELDPLPVSLLKEHLDVIAPALKDLVNNSTKSGRMSTNLKEALLRPLLKKMGLVPIPKNFRPVSNLTYLSKLIERVVCVQISEMAEKSGNTETLQSAYRKHHSTETALLKVKADILQAMDNQRVVCLILLDLSAAFDTVNHQLLLNRLKHRFGFGGVILDWIRSYLMDRKQRVVIGDVQSDAVELAQGVPQGSVLGPILFSLYTSPLGDICRQHNVNFHAYADDQQSYFSFQPTHSEVDAGISQLQECINDIRTWMRTNLLKLNDKTEVMIIGTRQQLTKLPEVTVKIGNESIKSAETVRNLGIYWNKTMTTTTHINRLSGQLFSTLQAINKIRHLLNNDTTKIVMQALIISKLDYCNSQLIGSTKKDLQKLQRIQNMASRIIYQKRKYDSVTPCLMDLHWLRIQERVVYKVAVLMFHCIIEDTAPVYLKNLVHHRRNSRSLRSFELMNLSTTQHKLSFVQNSSFASVGLRIWNDLPLYIKAASSLTVFKKLLKTYLFNKSYGT